MKINVSRGEVIDRYNILQIKMQNTEDLELANQFRTEYDALTPIVDRIYANLNDSEILQNADKDLFDINLTIWNIENQLAECEANETFNDDFIELSRARYTNNAERTEVKSLINSL